MCDGGRLFNIRWQSGTVALTWLVVKDGPEGVFQQKRNYITLLSLPGKVYSRVLKMKVRLIVESRLQEEQCVFLPGRGKVDQLYTLFRLLEGSLEFAQLVHMCSVTGSLMIHCVGCSWNMESEALQAEQGFGLYCWHTVGPHSSD